MSAVPRIIDPPWEPPLLTAWTIILLEERPAALRSKAGRRLTLAFERQPGNVQVAAGLWSVLDDGPDETVGVRLAEERLPFALGLEGYLARHSSTVGEALSRMVDFAEASPDPSRCRPELRRDTRTQDEWRFGVRAPSALRLWPPQLADAVHASYVLAIRRFTGRDFTPTNVEALRDAVCPSDSHVRVFGPRFGCARGVERLSLPADVWEREMSEADPELARYLGLAASWLAFWPRDTFLAEVAEAILDTLEDGARLSDVAGRLALSTRTLQRRLSGRGVRFADMVDGIREKEARRLMLLPHIHVNEIAERLGFADSSGFRRACERWQARAPGMGERA